MTTDDDAVLHISDARTITLGTRDELTATMRQISDATGGSSGAGRWSRVFGLLPGAQLDATEFERLTLEAAELLAMLHDQLDDDARELLRRLASQ